MATLYSDLYGTPPNADAGTAPIYRGPHGHMAKGTVYVVRGSVTIATTLGATDKAALLKAPEGAKILRAVIVPSADLDAGNTFTFNFGWLTAGATAYASASTGLQSASAYSLDAATSILAAAAAVKGDQLELARVAGSLSAGTLNFVVELSQG